MLITCLLLVVEVCNVKLTNRKSWAGNLLMCSDLTLGPSKRWFSGFCELSFWWIQICISPMRRSSYYIYFKLIVLLSLAAILKLIILTAYFKIIFAYFLRAIRILFSPMVSGWAVGGKKFVQAVSQKP